MIRLNDSTRVKEGTSVENYIGEIQVAEDRRSTQYNKQIVG